ncbi:MAG TPA: LytTR family transcriptional regulator DNA-binding domain-containing protein [Thermodesulfobacteriota bacterium]
MDHRVRIAFATCGPTVNRLEPVKARFASVAEILPFPAANDGSDADALVPALRRAAPHAVVAFPKVAERLLRTGLAVPVFPMEMPADVLVGRVTEALERADSVGVLPPAGTIAPSTCRLLRRLGGAVHILPYENHDHLRDLVARCRRMGIRALVGGESLKGIAEPQGLRPFSLADEADEAAGAMGQAVIRAASQAAPRHAPRGEALARYGLILEKIAQGAIGPDDLTLCVDDGGRVTAAFASPWATGAGRALAPARPGALSVLEAVTTAAAVATSEPGESVSPVALDLYPLAPGDGGGYLAVVRSSRRPVAALPAGPAPLAADPAAGDLLARLDTLIARLDTLVRARRGRHAPRRFLASLRRRTFLIDWRRVRYFELRAGLVYASLVTGETYATNYTLADLAARVDGRDFFRIHRHVLVNLNYVTELERYGVSQFRVVLEGPDTPAFVVSRPASAALRKLLKY